MLWPSLSNKLPFICGYLRTSTSIFSLSGSALVCPRRGTFTSVLFPMQWPIQTRKRKGRIGCIAAASTRPSCHLGDKVSLLFHRPRLCPFHQLHHAIITTAINHFIGRPTWFRCALARGEIAPSQPPRPWSRTNHTSLASISRLACHPRPKSHIAARLDMSHMECSNSIPTWSPGQPSQGCRYNSADLRPNHRLGEISPANLGDELRQARMHAGLRA